MVRPALRPITSAKVSRRPVLFRRAALLAALGLSVGCASTQQTPAARVRSRQLVTVTYPTPQTLRARAASRDSVLAAVTMLEGWSTGVRGDTLEVQIGRWQAEGRRHEMRPPDFVVAVLPEAGAAIRIHEGGSRTVSWMIVGLVVVLAAVGIATLSGLGASAN
jgi:hypothetical protein